MATRYVGKGGSDGNSGLTWALRKLTLTGAEDTPIQAGDTVYVGPGVYREQLQCDVNGWGNWITYRADLTGENTDGIGGEVVISGSDDDLTATRDYCIYMQSGDHIGYRVFTGFRIEGAVLAGMHLDHWISGSNVIVQDCVFDSLKRGIELIGCDVNYTIRRCVFLGCHTAIDWNNSTGVEMTNAYILDCLFFVCGYGIDTFRTSGINARNCSFICCIGDVNFDGTTGGGQNHLRNNIMIANSGIILDNDFDVTSMYNMVNSGSQSSHWVPGTGDVINYASNLRLPILTGTNFAARFPAPLGELNEHAYAGRRTGSSKTASDMYGTSKPANAKSAWGAVQFYDRDKETGTVRTGKVSMKVADAGRIQFFLPVATTSTTVTVYVYREANYAGTNPQMTIRENGQGARTVTDAAAASQWNKLTSTFTPQAESNYVIVELVSNNTATSGSFAIYFDDLEEG